MKNKSILTLLFAFSIGFICLAQITAQDSANVHTGVNTAITVGELVTGHVPLIPGIPDHITGGILSGIIFFFWRILEKRKLRKKGLLTDGKK